MASYSSEKYEEILNRITQPNEISKCLNELLNEERNIETNLLKLINNKYEVLAQMDRLTKNADEILENVMIDSNQLCVTVENTCQVASAITDQVCVLDASQSNVKETINRIHIMLSRKECIENLQHKMNEGDFEGAALCIEKFDKLEKEDEPDEQQKIVICEYKTKLEQIVHKKFNEYAEKKDHDCVIYFTKLFKSLNKKDEGINKISDYLKVRVAMHAHEAYQKLIEKLDNKVSVSSDFIKVLTEIFKFIAVTVEENKQCLLDVFGVDGLVKVIYELQSECDSYGSKIIKRLIEERKITRVVKEINLRKRKDLTMASANETVDPRHIEIYIEELLLVCSHSEEYIEFMLENASSALTSKGLASSVIKAKFEQGTLSICTREVIGYYITLEEYYMEENMKKAIEIDEYVSGTMTTSMIDDTFFISRKCSTRAIATRNFQCICSILSLMNSLLSQHLVTVLKNKMSEGPAKFINCLFSMTDNNTNSISINANMLFGAYLNNSTIASVYVSKLRSELEIFLNNTVQNKKDKEAVKSILEDLTRVSADLKKLTFHFTEQTVDAIMPEFAIPLDNLSSFSYELSEQEYSQNEIMDSWPQKTLRTFKKISDSLSKVLSSENTNSILQCIIERLVSRIELLVLRKKYNQLGGLQMDRDIRRLISRLSEESQNSSIRDKFSRLSQMATILCFENVEEMLDYWGEGSDGITWKWTIGEIKTIMRLRTDFKDEEIAALLL